MAGARWRWRMWSFTTIHNSSMVQFVMRIWSFNFFSSSFICFLVYLLPHRKSNFHFMFPASHRTNVCLWLSMRNDHLYCLLVYQFVEQNMYQSQILKKGSSLHLLVLTYVGIKLFVSSNVVKLEFWVYLLVHISVCIKLICYIFLRVHISVCIKLIVTFSWGCIFLSV